MKVIHQGWALVGQVLVVDDEGNALDLGLDAQGGKAKFANISIPVARFRGNEFERAYQEARSECEKLLAKMEAQSSDEAPLELVKASG